MNAAQKKSYFTVEEANQRLPLVRAIVSDIVRLYRDVHERRERLTRIRQLPGGEGRDEKSVYSEELQQVEKEIDKDIARVEEFVNELHQLGAQLKDPVTGLVDFPTLVEGRQAYLCWRLGEKEIGYWHELDAGFRGRQSVFETLFTDDSSAEDESG